VSARPEIVTCWSISPRSSIDLDEDSPGRCSNRLACAFACTQRRGARCRLCLIAIATIVERGPIGSSCAAGARLCTGCNGSGRVALLLFVHSERVVSVSRDACSSRAERSFARLAADDRACPRSRTARQPDPAAGPAVDGRWRALTKLNPVAADCVKGAPTRSRTSRLAGLDEPSAPARSTHV
jgi:hypothetical protein